MKKQMVEISLVIPIHIIQKFLDKGKLYGDLLCVYTWYYNESIKQQTNSIKADIIKTAKNIHISAKRLRNAKKVLKELGLLKDTVIREGNRIKEHRTEVNLFKF